MAELTNEQKLLFDDCIQAMQDLESNAIKENEYVKEKIEEETYSDNVVEDTSVSASLTGTEKLRYTNIGTEFFKGGLNTIVDFSKKKDKELGAKQKKNNVDIKKSVEESSKNLPKRKKFDWKSKLMIGIVAVGALYLVFKKEIDGILDTLKESGVFDSVVTIIDLVAGLFAGGEKAEMSKEKLNALFHGEKGKNNGLLAQFADSLTSTITGIIDSIFGANEEIVKDDAEALNRQDAEAKAEEDREANNIVSELDTSIDHKLLKSITEEQRLAYYKDALDITKANSFRNKQYADFKAYYNDNKDAYVKLRNSNPAYKDYTDEQLMKVAEDNYNRIKKLEAEREKAGAAALDAVLTRSIYNKTGLPEEIYKKWKSNSLTDDERKKYGSQIAQAKIIHDNARANVNFNTDAGIAALIDTVYKTNGKAGDENVAIKSLRETLANQPGANLALFDDMISKAKENGLTREEMIAAYKSASMGISETLASQVTEEDLIGGMSKEDLQNERNVLAGNRFANYKNSIEYLKESVLQPFIDYFNNFEETFVAKIKESNPNFNIKQENDKDITITNKSTDIDGVYSQYEELVASVQDEIVELSQQNEILNKFGIMLNEKSKAIATSGVVI